MANQSKQFDFYEEYVTVKSAHLMSVMDYLIVRMQQERCTVRHYKQWEAEMTAFKEEYRIFRKNILRWINDTQDLVTESKRECMVSPCCEEMEDRYEILAQIFLDKSNEIKNRTTYFETQQLQSKRKTDSLFKLKQIYDNFDIHVLAIKLRRK